jgi:hypothetical protein
VSDLYPNTQCQEDESCWDCTTMGNRECGTSQPAASPTPAREGDLAFTGGDVAGLALIGAVLVAGGWAMGRATCKRWIAR